jgi:hypothetical protein
MRVINAIDALDDLIHEAPAVPLTDTVRLDDDVLRSTAGQLRSAATEMFGAEPERHGPIGDLLRAVDGLDELIGTAKRVPMTSQVRVSKERFYDQLDRVRATLSGAITESASESGAPWTAVLSEIDRLEEQLNEFRGSLLPWIKVDARMLRDASARVRVSANLNLAPPSGPHDPIADLFAALEELDALVGDAAPTDRVRMSRLAPFVLIGRMREAVLKAGASARAT